VLAAREPLGRPEHRVGVEDVVDRGASHRRLDERAEAWEQQVATPSPPLRGVLRRQRGAGE
jgi:hypothetical protein